MKKTICILFYCFIVVVLFAQKHDNIWLLGYGGGSQSPDNDYFGISILDFSSGELEITDNQVIEMNFSSCNTSYCDSEGNLLYYSNGVYLEDASFQTMLNGEDFNEYDDDFYSLPQGVLALPFPEKENKSIFFYAEKDYLPVLALEVTGLFYSIIDMEGNGGLGEVVLRKEPLIIDTLEYGKLAACKHANGRDFWIVINEAYTNRFYKILIDPNGVNVYDNQTVGMINTAGLGQSVFSPDGQYFVMFNSVDSQTGQFVEIYDFNRCSGIFRQITGECIQCKCFRWSSNLPNSRYLYVSSYEHVYQYDLWASDIESTKVTVAVYDGYQSPFGTRFYMAQLAPDGKIYLNCPNGVNVLHVIHNPNEPGLACNMEQHGIQLPTPNASSLPNFPNYRLGALEGSPCDSLITDTDEIKLTQFEISIFPNPAIDELNLAFNESITETLELTLYSISGQQAKNYSLPKGQKEFKIDISSLSQGMYFYQIRDEKEIYQHGKVAKSEN